MAATGMRESCAKDVGSVSRGPCEGRGRTSRQPTPSVLGLSHPWCTAVTTEARAAPLSPFGQMRLLSRQRWGQPHTHPLAG